MAVHSSFKFLTVEFSLHKNQLFQQPQVRRSRSTFIVVISHF